MTGAADRSHVLREALQSVGQRGTALRLLLALPTREREAHFDRLVELASVGHADIGLVRDVILTMPREWVLARIEPIADRILDAGGEDEYRRFLELFADLDKDLALRLASRAIGHPDDGVREAGEDFKSALST